MYLYFLVKYSYRGWKASSTSFSGQKWALFFIIVIPILMFIGNLFRIIGFISQIHVDQANGENSFVIFVS